MSLQEHGLGPVRAPMAFMSSVLIVVNKKGWVELACYTLSETRPRIGNWKHLPAFSLTWREIVRYCQALTSDPLSGLVISV